MNDQHSHLEQTTCATAQSSDPLVSRCHAVIRLALRLLAVLMTFVIFWGVFDVVWVLWQRMRGNDFYLLNINDILATFGAFITVLIAIEIFENIVMYLRNNFIQVRLVLATALMAAARKVIVFDFKELSPDYIWATGGVILGLGLTYWLVAAKAVGPRSPGALGTESTEPDEG